jgi:hypothetical protein
MDNLVFSFRFFLCRDLAFSRELYYLSQRGVLRPIMMRGNDAVASSVVDRYIIFSREEIHEENAHCH